MRITKSAHANTKKYRKTTYAKQKTQKMKPKATLQTRLFVQLDIFNQKSSFICKTSVLKLQTMTKGALLKVK